MHVIQNLLLLLALLFTFADAEEICDQAPRNDEHRLKKALMCNYDSSIQPLNSTTRSTNANLNFQFLHAHLGEVSNLMFVHMYILIGYRNDFLKWEPKDFGNISRIMLPGSFVWSPELQVINSYFPSQSVESFKTNPSMITHDGNVTIVADERMASRCSVDIYKFPHDSHDCTIQFFVPINQGKIWFKPLQNTTIINLETKQWKLEKTTAVEEYLPGSYTLYLNFRMIRQSNLITSATVIPITVSIILTLLSFWINVFETFRFILLMTSFLIQFIYLQYLGNSLPPNGEKGVFIVIYIRNSVIMCGLAMVLLCINRAIMLATSTPQWLINTYQWVKKNNESALLLLPEDEVSSEEILPEEVELGKPIDKSNNEWALVSCLFDRICFMLYLVIYLGLFSMIFLEK